MMIKIPIIQVIIKHQIIRHNLQTKHLVIIQEMEIIIVVRQITLTRTDLHRVIQEVIIKIMEEIIVVIKVQETKAKVLQVT